MNKKDASRVVAYLVALYPHSNLTEQQLEVIGDLFERQQLDVKDGMDIVKEHAAKYAWPTTPMIAGAIKAMVNWRIAQATKAAQDEAAKAEPGENHWSVGGYIEWLANTPEGREEFKRLPANVRRTYGPSVLKKKK